MRRQTRDGDREGSLQKPSRKRSPTERGQRDNKNKGPAERPKSSKIKNPQERQVNKVQSHKDRGHKKLKGNE